MAAPGITFQLLDGRQGAAHVDELQALHAEVYAAPPYSRDDDAALFADRFRVQCRQPGFVLAEARHGGYLVGYACGMPLRPSTSWWRHLTTPLPDEVTSEHPGRTFALVELVVRPSWRRQGIAQTLHDLMLADRAEERATVTVLPAASPAQNAFRKWGWHKIARTQDPGGPVSDMLVTKLPLLGRRHVGSAGPMTEPTDRALVGVSRSACRSSTRPTPAVAGFDEILPRDGGASGPRGDLAVHPRPGPVPVAAVILVGGWCWR